MFTGMSTVMDKELSQQEIERIVHWDMKAHEDAPLFAKSPVWAIERYLQFFGADGRLQGGRLQGRVPLYILEALAKMFSQFMNDRRASLETAFGGACQRQRKAIWQADREAYICFALYHAKLKARSLTKQERTGSTPFEWAVAEVAAQFKSSEENIRRISKKRSREKKGLANR